MRLRRYEDHECDAYGTPWTDEPVPELAPGVAAHYARHGLEMTNNRYPGVNRINGNQVLARHFGGWGRPADSPEWLPVRIDSGGTWEPVTKHPEAVQLRTFAGGEGSVRENTGHTDVFHAREVPPQSPLKLHGPDRAPQGVEGPVEIAYFWDGYREPTRPFGWPVFR